MESNNELQELVNQRALVLTHASPRIMIGSTKSWFAILAKAQVTPVDREYYLLMTCLTRLLPFSLEFRPNIRDWIPLPMFLEEDGESAWKLAWGPFCFTRPSLNFNDFSVSEVFNKMVRKGSGLFTKVFFMVAV